MLLYLNSGIRFDTELELSMLKVMSTQNITRTDYQPGEFEIQVRVFCSSYKDYDCNDNCRDETKVVNKSGKQILFGVLPLRR